MNRAFGIVAALAAFSAFVFGQGYQPGPYAPRQPYPARPLTPYGNPALTNYYQQRQGVPGRGPYLTNSAPGTLSNRYAPNRSYATNFVPGNRFATNAPGFSNYNRFAPNPYSFTNLTPRAGYNTNVSRFAPARTNFPGYATATTNFFLTNASGGSNSFASPSGTTNSMLPNSTNSQSRLALTPAQRQSIDRLTAIFHTVKNPPVTSTQRVQILQMLRASIRGPAKPSDEAVTKLVDDLVAAWPSKTFTYQQKFQLAVDLNRVLNSGNLTEGEALVVVNDARRVLQQVGVNEESKNTLIDDLSAITGQVQKTSPKETASAPEAEK